jgi:hypothetical protein
VHELFPILGGAAAGALFATTRVAVWLRMMVAIFLAVCATMLSGEYRLGGYFLLLDLAEVCFAAMLAFAVVRARVRRQV